MDTKCFRRAFDHSRGKRQIIAGLRRSSGGMDFGYMNEMDRRFTKRAPYFPNWNHHRSRKQIKTHDAVWMYSPKYAKSLV